MDSSRGDAPCCAKTVVSIKSKDPELFVVESREAWPSPGVDASALGKARFHLACGILGDTPPELNGGREANALRPPKFALSRKAAGSGSGEAHEASEVIEEFCGECSQGLVFARMARARSQDNGDKITVAKPLDPAGDAALRGAVFAQVLAWAFMFIGAWVLVRGDHA
jgi:hypothetical protein